MSTRPAAGPDLRTVAVIPARGGSKGVPGKNLRRVGGRPLVVRAVEAAVATPAVDAVFVSTDDAAIAAAAEQAGAGVVHRPAGLSGDEATSEAALLHALDDLAGRGRGTPEVLAFLQCTSPFLRPVDLQAAVRRVHDGGLDCAFSAVATFDFSWRDADPTGPPGAGTVVGVNHDAAVRPRRQDRRPDFRETGGFYVMRADGFRAARHRFFGRTGVVAVPELTALEVDTLDELRLAEAVAELVDEPPAALDVDVVVTDFDGVHTDDTATVDQHGTESVRVSRSDGLGVEMLRRAGVPLLVVSKERNPVVAARGAKLGVEVLQGVEDKATAVLAWLSGHGIDPRRAAYVGNDVNDLAAMAQVGWPVAVADARPAVRRAARLVLSRPGGSGAVREVCELVLRARPAAGGPDGRPGPRGAATTAPDVERALSATRRP